MNKEGSTQAPTRHPVNFNHPDFLDPKKLDDEMRRVFDICHGCRRCFNLCDSFPKLFEMIDESKNENVESLSSKEFPKVVDEIIVWCKSSWNVNQKCRINDNSMSYSCSTTMS